MSLPGNGIFVVQGEMAMLVTAMRRSTRWGSHSFPNEEYDVLMRTFQDLKTILNQVDDLRLIDPPTYLGPFLEVIRSKETTGPVTSLALSAIHKFLSYGLIELLTKEDAVPSCTSNEKEFHDTTCQVVQYRTHKGIQACFVEHDRSKPVPLIALQPTSASLVKPSASGQSSSRQKLVIAKENYDIDESYTLSQAGSSFPSKPSSQNTEDSSQEKLIKDQKLNLQSTLTKIKKNPRLYIGIPAELYFIVDIISKHTKLSENHILLCLMKIRLNRTFSQLADDFEISLFQARKIFCSKIPIIGKVLVPLVNPFTKGTLKNNLPKAFRLKYNIINHIIDCLEIKIQKPENIHQALTWSEYKKANTFKYLISCTPDGLIRFVSEGYGGRVSDINLVEHCKFLDSLEPRSSILADRDFKHIEMYLQQRGFTLLRPWSVAVESKLIKSETKQTNEIASLRIHMKRLSRRIHPTHPSVPATVEDIADAVTHARFVGTDHSSDGVVLMKILQVLRTLMLSPEGAMLTDESVCEIMLSCFRICFETRLTELLRRNAEQCLRDMTQLIFMRLPQFPPEHEAAAFATAGLSLKKRDKGKRRGTHSTNSLERKSSITEPASPAPVDPEVDAEAKKAETLRHSQDKNLINEAEITIEPVEQIKSPAKKHARHSSMDLATTGNTSISQLLEKCVSADGEGQSEEAREEKGEEVPESDPDGAAVSKPEEVTEKLEEYVNHRGIRFTPHEETHDLQPYGLVCVRELFRFLISLCNPLDPQNTSGMVHLGLCLAGTALEVGADHVADYPSLLYLVKDPLCRNLLSLLNTERISIFALDLQITFLLFEALRFHLKFQMEAFFKKIIEIISTDISKANYELKEIQHLSLESLAQIFRIPGLCNELYLNYDCDVYCMNVFEEITKLLSKNVVSSTAYNIHSLSLEALMTIIEAIEMSNPKESETEVQSVVEEKEKGRCGHVSLEMGGMDDVSTVSDHVTHDISQYFGCGRTGRHKIESDVPSEAELDNIRNMKKWVTQGTELFNQKPERGIEYLQEHGVLKTPLDPDEVAMFLRENPDLDKKMIGEYICKRSPRDDEDGYAVLAAFAGSFDYAGLRIDQALRLYLETFRLPGEAPLIFLVMERFAERWHTTNGSPFANTDAAFRLAYAVIMLNMDQHNHNAKKLNVPMTAEDFVRNLRGCNGSGDFDQPMLEAIFYSIKNEEMVMPAERVGPVRDAYLWRVLQRRGNTAAGRYRRGHTHRLLPVAAPPQITALSAAFERSPPPSAEDIASSNLRNAALLALGGLERCAALLARLAPAPAAPVPAAPAPAAPALTVDTLLLSLCKFTGLLPPQPQPPHYIAIGVTLGQSTKAQLALRRACAVAARHADCVRDAWRHLLEIVHTLYAGRLLPKSLLEAEDYLSPSGTVSLIRDVNRGSEAGLLSSLYSYIALGETGMRAPTPHEKVLIDAAIECVDKCNLPGLLITETKFLQLESLQELIRGMVTVGAPPDAETLQANPQAEDVAVFFLELLGHTLIQNRDRALEVWPEASSHLSLSLQWACTRAAPTPTRVLTTVLRTCARLMRSELCCARALAHLHTLFTLPHAVFRRHCTVISCGLYELVKTSAQNVHSAEEWEIVFSLLCAAGAGAWPRHAAPAPASNAASSRSEGSEEEGERRPTSASSDSELSQSPRAHGWILVKNEQTTSDSDLDTEQVTFLPYRRAALARCCEALALVVRDVAHVTPHNCRAAVRAVRLFARATLHADKKPRAARSGRKQRPSSARRDSFEETSDEEDETLDQDHMVSLQLLDLMHTLHSRTAQIFKWWRDEADQEQGAEDYDLWEVAWKPLLQGIAEFCTDKRKQVANSAIAYLQRALLAPGLHALGGARWEACFERVLFPLLERVAPPAASRANTILCKVFLHHLSALAPRASFYALWLRVVGVQRALMSAPDDPLTEAALESLKNMILVMHSVRIFSNGEGYNDLWYTTWEKIGEFLPTLKDELFPEVKAAVKPPASVPAPTLVPQPPTSPATLPAQPQYVPPMQNPYNTITQPYAPPTLAQTFSPSPTLAQTPSPVNVGAPTLVAQPTLVAPVPVSGMVPIRNQLYDQPGLTSSVLLQPLNEMVSTPIGISLQSQMPVLYRAPEPAPAPAPTPARPPADPARPLPADHAPDPKPTILDMDDSTDNLEQSELYAEYLTNPYHDTKLSPKEATLYDPEDPQNEMELRNPLLALDKKSLSANATPMHTIKAQFGSTDNVRQEGVFNFTNYFGSNQLISPGSEVFDTLNGDG